MDLRIVKLIELHAPVHYRRDVERAHRECDEGLAASCIHRMWTRFPHVCARIYMTREADRPIGNYLHGALFTVPVISLGLLQDEWLATNQYYGSHAACVDTIVDVVARVGDAPDVPSSIAKRFLVAASLLSLALANQGGARPLFDRLDGPLFGREPLTEAIADKPTLQAVVDETRRLLL